jgi:surface polysaccharide O-acyltransferase-like enzyme
MTAYLSLLIIAPITTKKNLMYIFFIISCIYHLTSNEVMPIGINEHLNPLLWLPYFLFGYYFYEKNQYLSFRSIIGDRLLITLFIAISFQIALLKYKITGVPQINYRSTVLVMTVFLIFIFFSSISTLKEKNKFINTISNNTLFIYLWHMPLIGLLNYVANKYIPALHLATPAVLLYIFYKIIFHLSKVKIIYHFKNLIGIKFTA